ncbi:MAG: pyrroline-5-carboxylate reductase [Candidatus Homeothermus sp.]|nr:pyrroline-5-carboxylate reductase [Candidatus Homeothermus sp.]
MKLTIIGGGNMGGAIARGLVASGTFAAADITLAGPHQNVLDKVAASAPGIVTMTDNGAAIKGADVIILAVKPWVLPGVLEEIAPRIAFREQSIVSLAAGISLADIDGMLHRYSSDRTLFRAMPNTAMSVGCSMTFLCHDGASQQSVDDVVAIFDRLGSTAVIEERLMGAATALCSCGIAYVMRYVRAATEGAVELGLYPDKARDYMLATMKGAVALLEATGNNPEVEIDKVTTPGGITIKGLNAMEAHGFTTSVIEGLKASAK